MIQSWDFFHHRVCSLRAGRDRASISNLT